MSDEVSLRCSNREVLLFNTGTGELMDPYQLNWMAQWSQASSSSSPIPENSPASYHMLNSSDARGGNIGKISNNLHSMPPVNCENFTSYCLRNSNGSSSDWTHFPMFEINKKMESIMSRKRESSLTHIKAKIDEQILTLSKKSSLALNLTQSADEGHLLHQSYINSRKTVAISKPNCMNPCYSENKLHFSSKQIDNSDDLNKSLISCPEEIDRECSNEQEFLFGRNKKCWLITNGTDQGEGSKVCTYGRDKRRSFFEKLTIPKVSNKICSTDNQSMKKYTEPLVLPHYTNTDIPGTSKSHQAESSRSQKIPQNDNLKILETEENSDASRTKTTSTDSKRPSKSPKETTHSDSEPSSKWLKRLRSSPLNPIPLNTKRFKKGDVSSSGEMQNLLARVVNYNKSISKNVECSQVDSYNENIWIKRWCKSSTSKKDALVLCEPENTKLTNEKYEAKQFPSLAAMALMGKQVINFRPCEFQKKGAATVWKIDTI